MSKRIQHELTYDAPLAEVAAMLADPEFRKQVCERQSVLRSDVTVEETAGATQVRVEQVHPTSGLPSFATKLVGEEIHLVQSETWATADRGDLTLTITGKPGEATGTAILREADGTTTETVDLTVKVGIPLVGGKIEGLIADLLVKALRAENATGRDWLARG